jgi:hypothetical protein
VRVAPLLVSLHAESACGGTENNSVFFWVSSTTACCTEGLSPGLFLHQYLSAGRFYIIGELLASFIVAGFATTYWGAGELRPPVACIAADL